MKVRVRNKEWIRARETKLALKKMRERHAEYEY